MVLQVDPTLRPILEPEPQAEIPIQLNLGDPMHGYKLLQRGNRGKRPGVAETGVGGKMNAWPRHGRSMW